MNVSNEMSDENLHLTSREYNREEDRKDAVEKFTTCGTNLLDLKIGDSGLIQSPNYPENYPPNAECTWWLKVYIAELTTFYSIVL